jgi:hypothetical protein
MATWEKIAGSLYLSLKERVEFKACKFEILFSLPDEIENFVTDNLNSPEDYVFFKNYEMYGHTFRGNTFYLTFPEILLWDSWSTLPCIRLQMKSLF